MSESLMALHNFLPDVKNGDLIVLTLHMHSLALLILQILSKASFYSAPGRPDPHHQRAHTPIGDTATDPTNHEEDTSRFLTSAIEEISKETDLGIQGHLRMSLGKKERFL